MELGSLMSFSDGGGGFFFRKMIYSKTIPGSVDFSKREIWFHDDVEFLPLSAESHIITYWIIQMGGGH